MKSNAQGKTFERDEAVIPKYLEERYCIEEKRMLSRSPFDNRSKCDVDIVTRHKSSPQCPRSPVPYSVRAS